MDFLAVLWLPILLSAVFVFIASSVMHTVLKYHASGCMKLDAEEGVRAAMKGQTIKPGFYPIPYCKMEEMGNPEIVAKYQEGPVAFLTVLPNGAPSMSKSLTQWFLFTLGVGVFVAYIAHLTLADGTDYLMAFRVTGAIATLAYCSGTIMDSIWMGQPWKSCLKFLFDGLVYGFITAGTFGWLWPQV